MPQPSGLLRWDRPPQSGVGVRQDDDSMRRKVSDRSTHFLGGDRLFIAASLVAIAFSFTSSTGRWRQLSSPRPVEAAASQSVRWIWTASTHPITGNPYRFQPSTAATGFLPAENIPAGAALRLQDSTVKRGQWWPRVGAFVGGFLQTPAMIYDSDYIAWLQRVGAIPPGVCWMVQQHIPSASRVRMFIVGRMLLVNASVMLLAISVAALTAASLAVTLTTFACGAFGCASAPTLAAIALTITPLGPALTAPAITITVLTTPFVLTTTVATAATIVAAQLHQQQHQWPATESFPCPVSQPALASIQARRRRHWHNVKRRAGDTHTHTHTRTHTHTCTHTHTHTHAHTHAHTHTHIHTHIWCPVLYALLVSSARCALHVSSASRTFRFQCALRTSCVQCFTHISFPVQVSFFMCPVLYALLVSHFMFPVLYALLVSSALCALLVSSALCALFVPKERERARVTHEYPF